MQYFGASTLVINDVTIAEGNAGTSVASFTVNLSPASAQTVTVQYATADGTAQDDNPATEDNDYQAKSGTVTFNPGETSKPVTVNVNGDTVSENNETFNVNLSNATNATIAHSQGVGTITNDDAAPTISINDVTVTEGNAGTDLAIFTVSISQRHWSSGYRRLCNCRQYGHLRHGFPAAERICEPSPRVSWQLQSL